MVRDCHCPRVARILSHPARHRPLHLTGDETPLPGQLACRHVLRAEPRPRPSRHAGGQGYATDFHDQFLALLAEYVPDELAPQSVELRAWLYVQIDGQAMGQGVLTCAGVLRLG